MGCRQPTQNTIKLALAINPTIVSAITEHKHLVTDRYVEVLCTEFSEQ